MTRQFPVVGRRLLACVLLLWGCGGKPQSGGAAGARAEANRRAAPPANLPPPAPTTAPDQGRDAAPSFDEPAPPHPPHLVISVGPGEWIENTSYRLRLETIASCGEAPARPGVGIVSLKIRYEARIRDVFFSPRDLRMQRGGVILEPEPVRPCNLERGCCVQLPAQRLRKGQRIEGSVLFAVPNSFRAMSKPIALAYQPTRWGGAARVEIHLPACLDTCDDAQAAEKRAAPKAK